MSEAASTDSDAEPTPQTDVDPETDPVAKIHLSGPATFERRISGRHDVTATHENVTVEGTLVVGQQGLFEIAPPESSLGKEYLLRKILGHEDLRDGYTHGDPDEWNLEFEATVEDWRALTVEVKDRLPYRQGDPRDELALKYLASLANAGVLGESGLMAILELGQDPDVSFSDRKRSEILDALHPDTE